MIDRTGDDQSYGRFIKPDEAGRPSARDDAAGLLLSLVRWLHGQDPNVLGMRLVREDREAGGRPMIHVAFPLGHKRSISSGEHVRAGGTIADLLGPEIASGKRLNVSADANFGEPYSYLRFPPEVLDAKVDRDVRRLRESLRVLDEEIRPTVAAVVLAAEGEIDHATIAAPADWEEAFRQNHTPSPGRPQPEPQLGPASAVQEEAEPEQAGLIRTYLTSRGMAADTVATLAVVPFSRDNQPWLRITIPRGGTLRTTVPAVLADAGIKVMKNTRASTDEEVFGTIYCRAAEVASHLAVDQNSMREYRPKDGGRRVGRNG